LQRMSEMKKLPELLALGVLLLCIVGGFVALSGDAPKPPAKPAPAVTPAEPECPDGKCPRRQWGRQTALSVGEVSFVNGRTYGGEGLTCDFPPSFWVENVGSRVDDEGMCVATSIEMIGRYLGLYGLAGFRDWCAKEPGGADPKKIEDQLARFCKRKHIPVPPYVDYVGPDPTPLMAALDAAGLPYAHYVGRCPRYRSAFNPTGKIQHMVFSVKFSGKYTVMVDNNAIGGVNVKTGNIFEWMANSEALGRMKMFGGPNAWVFAFLVPPPPPIPSNGG